MVKQVEQSLTIVDLAAKRINLAMFHLLLTILLGALLQTSWACPVQNGNSNTCDECSVYDYIIHETSVNNMFLNVNITPHEIINEVRFLMDVLKVGTPDVAFHGQKEGRPGTDPPCHSERVPGKARTGCALDVAVNTTSDGSLLCPWRYECDYDKNRIPQYLWKARCFDSGEHTSRAVSYKVPILKLDNICNPFQTNMSWRLEIVEVPVACVCVSSQ